MKRRKFSSFLATVLIFALIFSLFLRESKQQLLEPLMLPVCWKKARNKQEP